MAIEEVVGDFATIDPFLSKIIIRLAFLSETHMCLSSIEHIPQAEEVDKYTKKIMDWISRRK